MAEKVQIMGLYSRLNHDVLTLLKAKRYIKDFSLIEDGKKKDFMVELLYPQDKPAITGLKILSKPGRRDYKKLQEVRPVLGGLGISIISTSQGVMSDREARDKKIGGEILFQVW